MALIGSCSLFVLLKGTITMNTVSRAAYSALQEDLHEELSKTFVAFGKRHGATYSRIRLDRSSDWLEDASMNVLGFGLDLWPTDDVATLIPSPSSRADLRILSVTAAVAITILMIEQGSRLSDVFSLIIDAII